MRVLIVEDEPRLLRSLTRALRDESFAVDTAEDGEEGLAKGLDCDYDANVLDVMLPQLDGWGVLTKLRAKKRTPVLMLTARDAISDRVRGLDSGADDYLPKPFDLTGLLARLRAIIRRTTGHAVDDLALGDLVIQRRARTVRRGGEEIPLTAREFAILEYLALHRGEVISRTELYEHLFESMAWATPAASAWSRSTRSLERLMADGAALELRVGAVPQRDAPTLRRSDPLTLRFSSFHARSFRVS